MATRLFTRSLSLLALSPTLSRSSISLSPLLRLRPLAAVSAHILHLSPVAATIRPFSIRQTSSSLSDSNPNWSNSPPKETILLDGCDFEHWLVVVEPPQGEPSRDEIINSYIKTLAQVVGSDEEARMKIYSVSTRHYFAFGALVPEELSYKLKELPGVRWVLPDSYLDVRNKDYGGEPFINGQAVPYDPKYHAEWVLNNSRSNERNRRNDRPRNFDRSRNFERRRENVPNQNQGFQMNQDGPRPAPNMRPPNQIPNNTAPMSPTNMSPNNTGPNNMMQNNMGHVPQNMGYQSNNAQNYQNRGGPSNGGSQYQNNSNQPQNVSGRDMPPFPGYQ